MMIDETGERRIPGYATDIVTDMSLEWLDGRDTDRPFLPSCTTRLRTARGSRTRSTSTSTPTGTSRSPRPSSTTMQRGAPRSAGCMTIADDMGADDLKTELPEELRGPDKRRERMSGSTRSTCATASSASSRLTTMSGGSWTTWTLGLAENTLVVYTSDQGFFLGDHGWFDKRLMFDQSLQMPMLMRWPADIAPGSRCDAIITNVDFAATFLDVAGIDTAAALPTSQGRSFRPLLRGESGADWPDAAYYRYWEHDEPVHRPAHYGVRTADHKLIHHYGAGLGVPGASDKVFDPEWELYDLRKDPSELHNVADDPAYQEVRAELERKLADLQRHYRDEPYVGPGTRPEWGPYDEKILELVAKYVAGIQATGS